MSSSDGTTSRIEVRRRPFARGSREDRLAHPAGVLAALAPGRTNGLAGADRGVDLVDARDRREHGFAVARRAIGIEALEADLDARRLLAEPRGELGHRPRRR